MLPVAEICNVCAIRGQFFNAETKGRRDESTGLMVFCLASTLVCLLPRKLNYHRLKAVDSECRLKVERGT